MTELLPYYRLSKRYALPALFVMNKCETPEMLEDYRRLVESQREGAPLFAIARDDAAYQPPAEMDLAALRGAIAALAPPPTPQRFPALSRRVSDLLGRLRDQVIEPLRADRRAIDGAVALFAPLKRPHRRGCQPHHRAIAAAIAAAQRALPHRSRPRAGSRAAGAGHARAPAANRVGYLLPRQGPLAAGRGRGLGRCAAASGFSRRR